jgi:vacuolar-type H+-ATPase subunit E/Vma4
VIELGAYRRAREAAATAEAERLRSEAEAAAEAELAAARRTADALLEQARADGTAQADREIALARAHEQRRARTVVLAARREAYRALCEQAGVTALELSADPRYMALLDRLEELARQQLGDDARIERDPAGIGGVVAEGHGRRVDYSLPALVERSVRALGAEVEQLWS